MLSYSTGRICVSELIYITILKGVHISIIWTCRAPQTSTDICSVKKHKATWCISTEFGLSDQMTTRFRDTLNPSCSPTISSLRWLQIRFIC